MNYKFWIIMFLQFFVLVSYSYLVYQVGVRDGIYDGYEVICGEDKVVLSTNIFTGEEVVRCEISSDFISYELGGLE